MERLQRGVVAVRSGDGVFVSWRLLREDPEHITFNVYRSNDAAAPGPGATRPLNPTPISESTTFLDSTPIRSHDEIRSYWVRPVRDGREGEPSQPFSLRAASPTNDPGFLELKLSLPPGYTPNDGAAGDLDGDGEYDLVLKSEQRPRDTASTGLTGETILQGYTLKGALLWTVNLGKNIREGAHYTQFLVYDMDGDGRAEVACKTADGTRDGKGRVLGHPEADWRDQDAGSPTFGRVLRGPEFLTVFDGRSGAALVTTNYLPARGDLGGWGGVGGNGGNDSVGNRSDRFLACVAYLDGVRPSLVFCRGYYGRSVLAAWDWRDGRLSSRWVFDSASPGTGKDGKPLREYGGMGAHSVSVADVDDDGKDEIVYHSMVVDDDGRGLFTTGLRHGDALHVGDFDPSRPGLEVFGVHENEGQTVRLQTPGTAVFDAGNGRILWSDGPGADVGRGLVADIDPRHPGAEMWSGAAGLRTCDGRRLGPAPRSQNFAIWWDGDRLRELLDGVVISKWDWDAGTLKPLLQPPDCASNNGSKATPVLCADLLGDWREEVIWRTKDNRSLRIYTSIWPTRHRFRTLMQDRQYRLAVAWQNVGYNQPPHPGFFLGEGMAK